MINTFLISFRLRTAYKANGFLYSLKQIPLVKRLLPDSLYSKRWLKVLANVISVLIEIGSVFLGKFLYIALMIFGATAVIAGEGAAPGSTADGFLHSFLFLSVIGAIMNTNMFNPTKDKYYAMILMRMNAREYTLTNYTYFLLKIVVGFMPFTILFGTMAGVSLFTCLLMPFFVVAVKVPFIAWAIRDYKKTNKARNENTLSKVMWAVVAVLLAAAYLPVAFGYAAGSLVFYIVFAAAAALSVGSFVYINAFDEFRRFYKDLLTNSPLGFDKEKNQAQMQNNYLKKIEITADEVSNKTGYRYFNELFIKRHRKLLTKSANKTALILLGILFVAVVACLANKAAAETVNGMILVYLPYFLFIMYLINRGQVVTQAMFMNCDHSMLTYRFYRQPKAILGLFSQRVKSVVAINLVPAGIIAAGLPLLLYLTGGTDNPVHYVVLFTSIIAMSIFFSVHHLVLYYLLQPYNVNLEAKSATYGIVNMATYFVCCFAMGQRLPIMAFGTVMIAFCVLYICAALLIAYRYAPKTFKLR